MLTFQNYNGKEFTHLRGAESHMLGRKQCIVNEGKISLEELVGLFNHVFRCQSLSKSKFKENSTAGLSIIYLDDASSKVQSNSQSDRKL